MSQRPLLAIKTIFDNTWFTLSHLEALINNVKFTLEIAPGIVISNGYARHIIPIDPNTGDEIDEYNINIRYIDEYDINIRYMEKSYTKMEICEIITTSKNCIIKVEWNVNALDIKPIDIKFIHDNLASEGLMRVNFMEHKINSKYMIYLDRYLPLHKSDFNCVQELKFRPDDENWIISGQFRLIPELIMGG